jgi:hypothetical protein
VCAVCASLEDNSVRKGLNQFLNAIRAVYNKVLGGAFARFGHNLLNVGHVANLL